MFHEFMDRVDSPRHDTDSVSGYCLGRRSVPVDVCRPRRRISAPMQAAAPKVVVHPAELNEGEPGVPRAVARDSETTQRIAELPPRGLRHAQLRALAESGEGKVTLAGRYTLDRCIGRGGMATVFGGEQFALGRRVAVKVLDDQRGLSPGGLQRFLREARTIARIEHPNVVEVHDLGSTREGVVYIVMERLEGEDLKQLISREGGLPWAEVRELMIQICAGLEAIHAAGVVHRDLKPANCFRAADGLKLLDFGIAASSCAAPLDQARTEERLTLEGQVVGTPEYMSPEQARGEPVDGRSDIYAAGIVLGELLTGQLPFVGKTAASVIAAHIEQPAPSLRALAPEGIEIDPELEAIYARALSKDVEDRYSSATELREAIEAVGSARPGPRKWYQSWRSMAAASVLFGAMAGG